MRRQLWWFICSIEARASEDHGIFISDPVVNSSSTRFPSNGHDNNLDLAMKELPLSTPMWTPMTFCLVTLETSMMINRSLSLSSAGYSSKATRKQFLKNHLTSLEDKYLKHCSSNIPFQCATILIGRLLSAKASFVSQQQELKRMSNPALPASGATEESYHSV